MKKLLALPLMLAMLFLMCSVAQAGAPGEGDPTSRFGSVKWLRTMYAKADFVYECSNFYYLDSRDYLRLKNNLNRWSHPIEVALTTGLGSPVPITIDIKAWTIREAECHEALSALKECVSALESAPYMFDSTSYGYLSSISSKLPAIEARMSYITDEVNDDPDNRNFELIRDWAESAKTHAYGVKRLIEKFAYRNKVKVHSLQ